MKFSEIDKKIFIPLYIRIRKNELINSTEKEAEMFIQTAFSGDFQRKLEWFGYKCYYHNISCDESMLFQEMCLALETMGESWFDKE